MASGKESCAEIHGLKIIHPGLALQIVNKHVLRSYAYFKEAFKKQAIHKLQMIVLKDATGIQHQHNCHYHNGCKSAPTWGPRWWLGSRFTLLWMVESFVQWWWKGAKQFWDFLSACPPWATHHAMIQGPFSNQEQVWDWRHWSLIIPSASQSIIHCKWSLDHKISKSQSILLKSGSQGMEHWIFGRIWWVIYCRGIGNRQMRISSFPQFNNSNDIKVSYIRFQSLKFGEVSI